MKFCLSWGTINVISNTPISASRRYFQLTKTPLAGAAPFVLAYAEIPYVTWELLCR